MKKNFYSFFLLVFICAMGTGALGQEKTGKPLMKITVKDGKIVSALPVDGSGNPDLASETPQTGDLEQNQRTIISNGVEQNNQIDAPARPDTIPSPDRALMRPNPRDTETDMSILVPSPADPGEPGADPDDLFTTSDMISGEAQVKTEKGQFLEAKTAPASAVFDPETAKVRYLQDDSRAEQENYVAQEAAIRPEAAWELIYANDWEVAGPYDWNIYAASGATDAYWDDLTYRASNGLWSIFCADGGTAAVTPPANYPNDMDAWAIYGPFDLSDATQAEVDFMLWLEAETDYDYFSYMVSVDGTNFEGWSSTGATSGWWAYSFDLTSVPVLGDVTGNPEVYFALRFESDYIIGREGAFVDEIEIWKYAQDVDLQPTSLPLSTTTWYPGLTVSGDLTVANNGTDPSQAHYSRIYLSDNTSISTSDIQLGGDLYYGPIAAGGSQTVYGHTWTAPNVPDGTYYVGIIVDIYNDCHETNEMNTYYLPAGITYLSPADIDLRWTYLAVSTDSWYGGLSVTATLTETNDGTDPSGGHYTRLYLSDNTTISSSDTQLGGDLYFSSIAAGGTQDVAETFTAPAWPSGTYYMGAIVDYYNDVAESDETNNIERRSGPIYYEPDIDLMSTSIGLSSAAWVVGSPLTADLTVVNNGIDPSGAHYSRLYVSADNTISTGDVQLGGDLYFSSIAGGGSQTVSGHSFNAPDIPDGSYYVGNIIDIYDDVAETDESNNYAHRVGMITSTHPAEIDLFWTSMALSSTTWVQGDLVTADLTVANDETAAAGAHYSRIYLSVDNTINTSDVQLGSDIYYSSVPAGGSTTETTTFTVPAESPGIYYLGAIVDFYNAVAENDESNNTNYRSGTVEIILPTYTISASVDPAGSGTVSGTGAYELNQTATLVATPATGYEFVNWTESGGVVSTDPSYAFTVTADRSLVANFQLVTLLLTTEVNPAGTGTASGGGSYPYGSDVTLSAVPATGYEFVNWTVLGAEVSTDPTYTFTLYENTVATANFTIATLTVTVVAEPADRGTVAGGGDFLYGETAVLAAVPAEGYEFRRWVDVSDVEISDQNPYSFTVTEDITIKGIFVDPTGIGDHRVQNFELYPNPVGDRLYVKVNAELSESVELSLYDVSGKAVSNYAGSHAFKDVLEIKTSHLVPGVYFLKITDEETDIRFTGKVIKK
jgi:subtilase family serine protease